MLTLIWALYGMCVFVCAYTYIYTYKRTYIHVNSYLSGDNSLHGMRVFVYAYIYIYTFKHRYINVDSFLRGNVALIVCVYVCVYVKVHVWQRVYIPPTGSESKLKKKPFNRPLWWQKWSAKLNSDGLPGTDRAWDSDSDSGPVGGYMHKNTYRFLDGNIHLTWYVYVSIHMLRV